MKKFFVISFLGCILFSACQGGNLPADGSAFSAANGQNSGSFFTNLNGSSMQNGVASDALGNTPEDQLTRTGMLRAIYSQEQLKSPQYLMDQEMGGTQQVISDAYRQAVLAGPAKDCLDKVGSKADDCFDAYVRERTKEDGVQAAFTDLKVLYDVSPTVQSYCHPLAHAIGHAAVDKYPTVAEAFEHGNSFCWSGYYHGVMEQIMENMGESFVSKIDTICADIPGKAQYSFSYYNCVHGMGHGLMDVEGDDLFKSLKMCDKLTGAWEDQSCYSGVFMQNVINDGLAFHSANLKPDDTVYPCNAVDTPYKDQCYLMQTSYMLKINGYDFKKTFDICANVDKGFSVTCYRSLGRDASGSSVSDLQKTHDTCLLGNDYTQQSECIVGAVKDFISYYHGIDKANLLCQSLNDPKQTQQALEGPRMVQYCLNTASNYYKSF